MNTLQLNKRYLVRDLAATIKDLSRKQKDRLLDLIWDDIHYIPKELIIPDEDLRRITRPGISRNDNATVDPDK